MVCNRCVFGRHSVCFEMCVSSRRHWEAIKKWDEAIQLTPDNPALYEMKSQVHHRRTRPSSAASIIRSEVCFLWL